MKIVFQTKAELLTTISATRLFICSFSVIKILQVIFIAPTFYQLLHQEMDSVNFCLFSSIVILLFISAAAGLYSATSKSYRGSQIASTGWLLVILLQLVDFVIFKARGSDAVGGLLCSISVEIIFVGAIQFFLCIMEGSTPTESALYHPLLGDESEELEGSCKPHNLYGISIY